MLQDINNACKNIGLGINFEKTKIMTNKPKNDVEIESTKLQQVENIIYLGQLISFYSREGKEIQRKILNGWKSYWCLKILKSKLPIKMQGEICNSCVFLFTTNNSQIEPIRKKQLNALAVAQNFHYKNLRV